MRALPRFVWGEGTVEANEMSIAWSLRVAASTVMLVCAAGVLGQTYPTGPVRVLIASAAGGSLDVLARLVGHGLSDAMGQAFVVEPRPGAGGNLAIEAL